MGSKSTIEWVADNEGGAGATWTPIRARNLETGAVGWHCTHASPGCMRCYAERMNLRLGTGLEFKPQSAKHISVYLDDEMLRRPLHWRKPRVIFVCSMTDLFATFVRRPWIDAMMGVMRECPHHTFIILTKRASAMRDYFTELPNRVDAGKCLAGKRWSDFPLPNVWAGVSCEDQRRADERLHDLLMTPTALRFASLEPMLSAIDLTHLKGGAVENALTGVPAALDPMRLDWVIIGGESGGDARPFHMEWATRLVEDCAFFKVPCFVKQMGSHVVARGGRRQRLSDAKGGKMGEWPDYLRVRQRPPTAIEQMTKGE